MNNPLEYDRFYHIYNRGNNYENIFIDHNDYQYFLKLYDIYIESVADTYAWCLLKNHFHILLRIRADDEIGYLNSAHARSDELDKKWKTYFPDKAGGNYQRKPKPSEQFQHLFASYTKYFNKKYGRAGSLFTKNFHRIRIENEKYFTNLIVYIHNNPVKHGFTEYAMDYPWSSYLTVTSTKNTKLKKEDVLSYFQDLENFKYMHQIRGLEDDDNLKGLIVE